MKKAGPRRICTSAEAAAVFRHFAVDPEEVWSILSPFVSRRYEFDDPEWKALVRKQERRVRNQLWRRMLGSLGRGSTHRTQAEIEKVYSERWEQDRFKPFRIPASPKGGPPCEWGGAGMRAMNAGTRRVRIFYMMRLIEALRPRNVLEIGFGEGVNLAILAARFPQTEFAGIELTQGGTLVAQSLQKLAELPPELVEFSALCPVDMRRHQTIDFRCGSAANLPWPNDSFDMVFSSLALEQMEEIRTSAVYEMARVCHCYTVMIEPFREFNARGLRRRYVRGFDYFQGAVADLPSYGLAPILVIDDLPAKVLLKPVVVVSAKTKTP